MDTLSPESLVIRPLYPSLYPDQQEVYKDFLESHAEQWKAERKVKDEQKQQLEQLSKALKVCTMELPLGEDFVTEIEQLLTEIYGCNWQTRIPNW